MKCNKNGATHSNYAHAKVMKTSDSILVRSGNPCMLEKASKVLIGHAFPKLYVQCDYTYFRRVAGRQGKYSAFDVNPLRDLPDFVAV